MLARKRAPGPAEISGRRHLRRGAIGADQFPALGGVFRGDQRRERHLDLGRVAVIGLAVGKGELQRLGQLVDVVGAVLTETREIGSLEQCQGLQKNGSLAPGAAGEDFEIAKAIGLGNSHNSHSNTSEQEETP